MSNNFLSKEIIEDNHDLYAGRILKKILLYKGITIKDFSKMTGLSEELINDYINGLDEMTICVLDNICKTLNVRSDYFLKSRIYDDLIIDDGIILLAGKINKILNNLDDKDIDNYL